MTQRILFISKGEDSASTRYRALQYFPLLQQAGFAASHVTAAGSPAAYFNALRQAAGADIVVVLRKTFSAPCSGCCAGSRANWSSISTMPSFAIPTDRRPLPACGVLPPWPGSVTISSPVTIFWQSVLRALIRKCLCCQLQSMLIVMSAIPKRQWILLIWCGLVAVRRENTCTKPFLRCVSLLPKCRVCV